MRTANHLDAHLHTAPSRICNKFWPLIGLAMSAVLLGVAGWLFGPQIFRIATDQGQILIESNDPNVQIEVSQSGELVEVIDLRTRQSVQIKSGTYQIHTVGDENTVTIDKDQLTLSRGETEIVQIQKNSELAKSAKSTSQFSASEPATSDIQDYEPSQPQRLTESVYNGMTLGECMNKIKYERNHEHLVAPLHAMFFISDPEFQPELVEPVTNAMLLFDFGWSHNPTGPFQLVQPYTDWLSNEQLQKVAIELSASDDFNHWGLLYGMLESASYSNRWTRSGADVQKELLRNIRHTISQESQVKEQALDVYLVLVDIEVFDPREHDELLQLVLEHTHRKAIFNAINDFDILAMASPDLHGLGAAIGKFIAKDRSSSSTNEINPDEGSDLILKLDRNNQKKAIVEFAKRLFSDQVTAEQPIAVEMLLKLDEDVFELVRPIYEAHKSNVNGILMTNSLKKAGRDR